MSDQESVIRLTADEINCLVYSFLLDSGTFPSPNISELAVTDDFLGFKHTAFSLRMEGHLENSPNFTKHIPRGELVDLLSKSLLYREVESHWKADHMATHCKATFSLLDPHVCSLEAPKPNLPPPLPVGYSQRPLGQSNRVNTTNDGKRKASPLSGGDIPAEKRPRHEMDTNLDCTIPFFAQILNFFTCG
jgi:transducin (beta)-like 1